MMEIEKAINVLMIDDDGDDCYLFSEALNRLSAGHRFTCGVESSKMYDYIEQVKPHLIFMDINMPGKNGIQCLKELKAHPQYGNIPVIIYSVSNSDRDKEECLAAGAHHYLVKPYVLANLTHSLKKVFSKNWKVVQTLPAREDYVIGLDF